MWCRSATIMFHISIKQFFFLVKCKREIQGSFSSNQREIKTRSKRIVSQASLGLKFQLSMKHFKGNVCSFALGRINPLLRCWCQQLPSINFCPLLPKEALITFGLYKWQFPPQLALQSKECHTKCQQGNLWFIVSRGVEQDCKSLDGNRSI